MSLKVKLEALQGQSHVTDISTQNSELMQENQKYRQRYQKLSGKLSALQKQERENRWVVQELVYTCVYVCMCVGEWVKV